MAITAIAFAQYPPEDSIIWDEAGNPLYFRDQIIVKFHPDLVDTSLVNDTTIQSGLVSDFINPIALQMIIDSGYFNQGLADLNIHKIHRKMTSYDTMSITRLGDTIVIPKFWSTFLIDWDDSVGMSFEDAIDTLNTLWPGIEYAHPNYIYQLAVLPNDDLFLAGEQEGLYPILYNASINIDPAWDMTVGKDNVRVGIFDTGINWDHEDFSEDNSLDWAHSRVKGGWDYVNKVPISNSTTNDHHGHGSALAGIVGAIRNNDIGVAGVAGGNGATNQWGVQLYDFKVVDNNLIILAENIVSDAVREGTTSFSINVMNHSWWARSIGASLKDQFRFAYKNSVMQAAVSGNFNGTYDKLFPGSLYDDWVMKVGANDASGGRWSSSTGGNSLDFLAPGVYQLYATTDAFSNTTYNYWANGTSYAAPHVAGVAGLMVSYINDPTNNAPNKLAPEDVENLLQTHATNLTVPPAVRPDDYTGFGRINAGATLQGIKLPKYEVKHYLSSFNNNTGNKIGSSVQIVLSEAYNGVPAGTYYGDVYEITQNFNIAQPSNRTILDVWSRNSSSTLFGGQPIIPEDNCIVTTWSQTSATMKGYIYYLNTTAGGQNVKKWFPSNASGLFGSGKMALTVYSYAPFGLGNNDLPINRDLVRVIPNPSNGNFTIVFTLLRTTDLGVEVTDLSGKVLYTQPEQTRNNGHQEMELNLSGLNAGMYICNLRTTEGSVSQKIIIVK